MLSYHATDLIPHRGDMLFVDKISSLDRGVQATGEWRPSKNRWLASHPEAASLLPFLPIEALAQLGACAVLALPRFSNRTPLLAGFTDVQYPNRFGIEDVVLLAVELITLGSRFGRARGSATVNARPVCQGQMQFVLSDTANLNASLFHPPGAMTKTSPPHAT